MKGIVINCLTLSLFLFLCDNGEVLSQSIHKFPEIDYYTTDMGLSQNEVTCILKDRMGFLWIGTRGGLNRFDGQNFRIFKNEIGNINSLSNNSIESIHECSSGYIWIGTKSNGLSRYDPARNKFSHYQYSLVDKEGIPGNRVISIAEGEKGKIWVGTWSNGLTIFDYQKNTYQNLLGQSQVTKILKSQSNEMWVATTYGIYRYDIQGKQLQIYLPKEAELNITDIIEDPMNGIFYLGSWNDGLWKLNPKSNEFSKVEGNIHNTGELPGNAYALRMDSEGMIWVGSWGGSLSIYNPVTDDYIKYNISSSDKYHGQELYRDILYIYAGLGGITWLGTNGGGICKVKRSANQFGQIGGGNDNTGLPNEPIYSILKDKDGIVWVGQKGNNYIFYSRDGKIFNSLLIPRLASHNRQESKLGAKTIYQAKDGQVWLSTNYSIYKIEKEPDISITPVLVNVNGENSRLRLVSNLFQTSDGVFWVGQQQRGLKRSLGPGDPENQVFKSYQSTGSKHSLNSDRISAFLEDNSGRLWIGTYNGLFLYRPSMDDFIHYEKIQGEIGTLSSNIVICLHEDKRGNLWVGTPNGLNLAIPGKDQKLAFQCFQEKDGLPDDYIQSILEDEADNLWVSSNKGISRFNPDEKVFVNFDVNDGLQSNSFMERAAWKNKDGLFFFGGTNGLNVFHPDSIQRSKSAPKIVLTSFKVFNKEVIPGEKYRDKVIMDKSIEFCHDISLSHDNNVFSINYTALDFESPGSNSYMYKMEGLDNKWNYSNKQTSVAYANLDPGNYIFQVKASNQSGMWSENQASIRIKILSPWWTSWQAIVLYILAFSGLLILYGYFINKQNELVNKLSLSKLERVKDKEMAELKTQFFTNITHELRTPLTLISGPIEIMATDDTLNQVQKDHLSIVRHHTHRLLNLVTELLDFRKAETGNMKIKVAKGNLVKYAHEIFLSFKDLAEEKEIQYQFIVSHERMDLYFDRNNMEIVMCNLLSNAFKHTEKDGYVTLSLRYNGKVNLRGEKWAHGCCEIIVEDSGTGMSKEVKNKIFDRYYQIANASSAKVVGTGIGLALVKNIVDLHGGTISVDSTINKGSKFKINLPVGKSHYSSDQIIYDYKNSEHISHYQYLELESLSSNECEETHHIDSAKKNCPALLIVEDNLEIRNFVEGIFKKKFKVYLGNNGKEGLKLAKEIQPDAIISDVMMPEMDGLEFCSLIKSDKKTLDIPFIILTARTSNVYQVEGYDSGADAYVTKPFHPSVLISQVESLITTRNRMKERFSKIVTLQPTDIEISSQDEEFLKQAINIIEKNISNDNLSREFLARSLSISASSLYRKIKSLTGFTTNAFVRSIRIKRAAQLMMKSQYNISEIAYQVGFNDLKYFRSCFKDQFGMNPSQYVDNKEVIEITAGE